MNFSSSVLEALKLVLSMVEIEGSYLRHFFFKKLNVLRIKHVKMGKIEIVIFFGKESNTLALHLCSEITRKKIWHLSLLTAFYFQRITWPNINIVWNLMLEASKRGFSFVFIESGLWPSSYWQYYWTRGLPSQSRMLNLIACNLSELWPTRCALWHSHTQKNIFICWFFVQLAIKSKKEK